MLPRIARLLAAITCIAALPLSTLANSEVETSSEPIPEVADSFLVDYCLNCHDEIECKGDLSLDFVEIDWSDHHAKSTWSKVHKMLKKGEMPPEKERQPTAAERQAMLSWLDATLSERDPPGGTVLRRLNREEYENTIRDALGIPFTAPESFPSDLEFHGFDNVGEGLALSPPLMAQYFEIATTAADLLIPPLKEEKTVPSETSIIGPNDFTLNFTTGHPIDGILRMTSSSDPLARGSVWPNRFAAKTTGRYAVRLELSSYRPEDGHFPIVKLLAFTANGNSFTRTSTLRELAEIRVGGETPAAYNAEVDLQKGETIVVHYDNATLSADQSAGQLARHLLEIFRADPELGAAWKIAGYQRSDRGWSWWDRIQKIKNQPGFSSENFDPESEETREFALKMARTGVNLFETMCCYRFFAGPGLDIHELSVSGPLPAEQRTIELTPSDFTSLDASGTLTQERLYRLISSRSTIAGSAVWPSRFEAKISGVYRIRFDATTFQDAKAIYNLGAEPFQIELFARKNSADPYELVDTMRKLDEFSLLPQLEQAQVYETEVVLEKGETIAFRWGNSPLYSDSGNRLYSPDALGKLAEDERILAAYRKLGRARELTPSQYYEAVMDLANSDSLDTAEAVGQEMPDLSAPAIHNQFARIARQDMIRHGPALDIGSAEIVGPVRLVEDNEMREQRLRTARFMGHRQSRDDEAYATAILQPFLDKAFRRPATDEQISKYVKVALQHTSEGNRFEDGIHLAIRAALCSPKFIYRGLQAGELDDYDLASRLSYFLTSSPPDKKLLKLASAGSLSDPNTLATETRRLLASRRVNNFIDSFAGQWLDLRVLPDIMPDPRLINWNDNYLNAITEETKMFIAEILRENHTLDTFIDPDFTYMNRFNARLYDHPFDGNNAMKRVPIDRGSRYGGILGQASVMMATANGVDTQPVLRGVWLLENVLGDPPSEPPPNVPAIEPDTSGAKTIRELLERHQADASCASCHRKIDPPGFALENFDPVGRWRTHYPLYEKKGDKTVTVKGQLVDAVGQLPDGTPIDDVQDLKRYLVENIDIFSLCLTEKLMVYATGRPPSFGDRKVIDHIVAQAKNGGNGFQDLIVALVVSDSFRAK